jgi:hypothetical protein
MKKYLITLLFIASIPLLFAQEAKKKGISNLDITLNSGYQRVDMKDLNAYYSDPYYKPHHSAFYKSLQLNYRLTPMMSIGTQLKVDQASVENLFTVLNRSIAFTGQIDGIPLLRQLIKKQINDDWRLQFQLGLSYNLMQVHVSDPPLFWSCITEPWYLRARLGGNAQVKLSYPIMKGSNTQWRLGLSVGYQYAQSKGIPEYGYMLVPVTIGFSGFNSGISLSCEINKRQINQLDAPSKNAIYVDVLGQSLYGAVMYERSLNVSSNGVQHSIAGGYFSFSQVPWTPMNLRMISLPFAYNTSYDFNKSKNLPNKLELGFGLTAFFNKEYGITEKYRTQEICPSIRIGYAYHSYRNGLLFKATMTPVLLGLQRTVTTATRNLSGNISPIVRFGISIGKTF